MKRIFLDCEFNGFQGDLLSMALVPENTLLPMFYREIDFQGEFDPWVANNVVPHMLENKLPYTTFQLQLGQYLYNIGDCHIVADWPDDIRYFCESLIVGPGERLSYVPHITFELDLSIEYVSHVPHHALYDAMAIRESVLASE